MADSISVTTTDVVVSSSGGVVQHPLAEQIDLLNTVQYNTLSNQLRSGTFQTSTTQGTTSTVNYISDIAVSAYMRTLPIDFFAYNLRPNRKVHLFFDDKNVVGVVQKPNVIEVDNNAEFLSIYPKSAASLSSVIGNISSDSGDLGTVNGQIDTSREEITIGSTGARARVLFTERSSTGNTLLYISEITPSGAASSISAGTPIQGVRSGSVANVVSYHHYSGYVSSSPTTFDSSMAGIFPIGTANANTINVMSTNVLVGASSLQLSSDASSVDNYYVGNTISFVTGASEETVSIVSYNGTTKEAVISPAVNDVTPGSIYSIGDYRSPYVANVSQLSHYTTPKGFLGGVLHIPGPNARPSLRMRTGAKLFKIADDPTGSSEDSTTVAEYVFNSYGLDISRGQVIINNPAANVVVAVADPIGTTSTAADALTPPAVINDPIVDTTNETSSAKYLNNKSPIAQSFYISDVDYPRGIYVPYIDLFFANKGTLPVELQIRVVNNGFPDGKNIIPNAVAIVEAEDVKVSQLPDANDSSTYTRFTFSSPVYLFPGMEYAMVVSSNDFDYDIYVSELGEKIVGSDRLVSQQPYLGSLFRSQNSSTYDALQSEDMMFVIHKCEFVSSGQVIFHEEKKTPINTVEWSSLPTVPYANAMVDVFVVNSDSIEIPGTTLVYSYKATTNSNNTLETAYTNILPDRRKSVRERKVVRDKYLANTESFLMKVDLSTSSKDVSPIIYKEKQLLTTGEIFINNLDIGNFNITIANTGNAYTYQNTSVSFNANVGSGANAVAYTLIEPYPTGKIGAFYFDGTGSGYADNVSINVTSSDGSGAVVYVNPETGISGGPAKARFITKTITLAPDFPAGDLRVYLTAVKPVEASIYVYYKVRNSYDSELIEEKRWVRMDRVSGINTDSVGGQEIEMEYRPSLTSNNIVYTSGNATFDTFNQFKIKVVLASSSTVLEKIPFVLDMRAVALPGDV